MSKSTREEPRTPGRAGSRAGRTTPVPLILGLAVALALLAPAGARAAGACGHSADMVARACVNEGQDDFWIALSVCGNLTDDGERAECRADAFAERQDKRDECSEQDAAREDLCAELGEERYDPEFDPADFETDFTGLNPYWPLVPGQRWTFAGAEETSTVEVQDKTKLVEGVHCIVVHDLVSVDGQAAEDTFDWYGQATNGDVYYCGEISLSLETFPGDAPEEAEVVDVEGSWKAGRDGAKPGIVMFGEPEVGTVYRQELSWGDAEDAAEIVATDYSYGEDPDLDHLVPQALAELLCHHDCVVTREFTPIEPDLEALKYYSPGIGVFLEVEGEATVQLTACNVDPRCAMLPAP